MASSGAAGSPQPGGSVGSPPQGGRRTPLERIGGASSSLAASLWAGAAAIGSYAWGLLVEPPSSPAGPLPARCEACIHAPGAARSPDACAHQRVPSAVLMGADGNEAGLASPAPSTTRSVLDEAEYGIRMVRPGPPDADAILTQDVINRIHAALPPRYRLYNRWTLTYSTYGDGFSLATLYRKGAEGSRPTLLVVRDSHHAVFGVFGTEPWRPHSGHYGTGETFLWRIAKDGDGASIVVKYGSTGKNSNFMLSEPSFIAAGCGENHFGFWLDADLLNGQSYPVSTFNNDTLASDRTFQCVSLELWSL